jgi:hypothetical protein
VICALSLGHLIFRQYFFAYKEPNGVSVQMQVTKRNILRGQLMRTQTRSQIFEKIKACLGDGAGRFK